MEDKLNVDHFGFETNPDYHKVPNTKERMKRDNARLEKWRIMLPKLQQLINRKDPKLKRRIRKGIPEPFRGQVWPMLANVSGLKAVSKYSYSDLIKVKEVPFQEDIDKDIERTFPDHIFFKQKDGDGQRSLRSVLRALALTYKDMGYCQGLNFIAALLVLYCPDEDAYWMMHSLMSNYHLLEYFHDPKSIQKPVFVLSELMKKKCPAAATHLAKHGIDPIYYAPQWFMTLYTNVLPFKLVVRLFDAFLHEDFKIIYRVGLAIIKCKERAIVLTEGFENLMHLLKDFKEPQFQDDDYFISQAFKISLSRNEIKALEDKYPLVHT